MSKRVPGSMRTRQSLSDLIEGRLSSPDARAELVRLTTAEGLIEYAAPQMEAVRQELDHEYEARNGLVPKPSTDADQAKLSSTSRT